MAESVATQVLIVDDEVAVSNALRRLLRRHGFRVETVLDAPQALAKLAAFVPDIVLSDFRLPGMNGYQLLAEVKRRVPHALRIIISGYANMEAEISHPDGGEPTAFISKPWDDDQLPQTLRQLLAERAR